MLLTGGGGDRDGGGGGGGRGFGLVDVCGRPRVDLFQRREKPGRVALRSLEIVLG